MKIRVLYFFFNLVFYIFLLNGFKPMLSLFFYFFYGDYVLFVTPTIPWFTHGGKWNNGILTGSFAFGWTYGEAHINDGSRLKKDYNIINI